MRARTRSSAHAVRNRRRLEGEAGEHYGQRKLAFEPIKGGAHVFDFPDAAGVLALAQSGAAEVKGSTGNPKWLSAFMVWKTTLLCSVPP